MAKLVRFILCLHLACFSDGSVNNSGIFGANVNIQSVLELLVPSSKNIANERCRRHVQVYLEEMRNFRLWAVEMFDATSKIPSGILVGSTYAMGNYDECVNLATDQFSGKYCLATLKIEPPKSAQNSSDFEFHISAWEKLSSNDRSKRLRNEIHWAFCIPSSCSHEDLQVHLKELTDRNTQGLNVTSTVAAKNCQTYKEFAFNTRDFSFLGFLLVFFSVVITATIYDLFTGIHGKLRLSGTKHEIILALSLWRNLNKLVLHSSNKDGLDCINGLKVISMFLIIMGHRIMFSVGSPLVNSDYVESFYSKVEAMVLLNGPIIVDSFFNISGFLACYLLLNEFETKGKSRNYFVLVLHRLIRITPAYAVVLAFYCTILVQLGSGPLWNERIGLEQERCLSSWWTNLLYVNNYVNADQMCMFQSWYITCDMHFFLITPVIAWLFFKKPKVGIFLTTSIILASIVSTFIVTYVKKFDALLLLYMRTLKDPIADETFRSIYIPTHTRASPYFVGLLTGYLKHKIKRDGCKFPNKLVYLAWILCVLLMEATVYSAYFFYASERYDVYASAVYASFHHFLWSVCISWFILALSTGNGMWIEPILSWKGLVPLSRLTYAAFLCHGGFQLYSVAILRQPVYASIFNLCWYTLGDIALAFTGGLVLCLFFESPVIGLEKIVLKR